ncbi:cytochrome d ubiquinol oxidase subunit II [Cytophagales bacterium LB-30]|uniref:Cytochrome d ubiquinol oxidase subunit II n=1 Tax=Shiella aurantiaca TaxID=3058365 RepID=A0ABT8F2W8_9BACT|nr:cytochrome d ubiquinol oxidase subunit II [Shiella aurantiaca]MDN4164800.1 cytochrome d ubiquinol oxidase subunit II [Shiella aurantiaca]
MLYVVITFFFLSVLLYLLLGGADFGAGIVELFTSRKNQEQTRRIAYRAIGPVWEANHMWLIIAIVILFVGFPRIYSIMSTHLHIPLLLMLMGITARGTAFVFRNYDAVKDHMQDLYNRIFIYSSFITPLFLGIIAGAMLSTRIDLQASSFQEAYLFPWLNIFSISVGFFTVSICGFLAAVFLVGEAEKEREKQRFARKAFWLNGITVALGAWVFLIAEWENHSLLQLLLNHPISLIAIGLATVSQPALWYFLQQRKALLSRLAAGFQVSMILGALGFAYFPNIILLADGTGLSLLSTAAPEATLRALGLALLLGSLFILPALFFLFCIFTKKEK